MVLEKTLESPLDCKEIQPIHSKGDQSWVFIGRTDVEAEIPILWPPDAKSWLIWKDPDAGKDLRAGGEGDDRGWDGWMALSTRWTWVWVDSGRWWWTGRPGMLSFMELQSRTWLSDWTELNPEERRCSGAQLRARMAEGKCHICTPRVLQLLSCFHAELLAASPSSPALGHG